jgi:hypothetical protein
MKQHNHRRGLLKRAVRGHATQAEVQRDLEEKGLWRIRVWNPLPDGRLQRDDTGEILTKEELREWLNRPPMVAE